MINTNNNKNMNIIYIIWLLAVTKFEEQHEPPTTHNSNLIQKILAKCE